MISFMPVGCSSSVSLSVPTDASGSPVGRLPCSCRPCGPEADRACVGTLLVGMPPPGIIFAPGRGPAVRSGLHTADHKGGASPVQEAEGASTAGDRTRILRFPVGEQDNTMALLFPHHRWRVFSALLYVPHPRVPSLGGDNSTGRLLPLRRP
jgi:hypothetical protein